MPFIARYRKERTGGARRGPDPRDRRAPHRTWSSSRSAAPRCSRRSPSRASSRPSSSTSCAPRRRSPSSRICTRRIARAARRARRSRASEGLQPLADQILAQARGRSGRRGGKAFVTEQVATDDDALAGARDIVAEQLADTAEIRAFVRREMADHGELISEVLPGKDAEPTKFEQYYKHREAVKQIPSHRYLAIRRGEAEGVLRAHVAIDSGEGRDRHAAPGEARSRARPWAAQLKLAGRGCAEAPAAAVGRERRARASSSRAATSRRSTSSPATCAT